MKSVGLRFEIFLHAQVTFFFSVTYGSVFLLLTIHFLPRLPIKALCVNPLKNQESGDFKILELLELEIKTFIKHT